MITLFRNFARSKWAVGLLVLVAIGLLVTGAQMDIFANLGPKNVITAGDRSIDPREFALEIERIKDQQQEQTGQAVTNEQLVERNLHLRFLEQRTQQLGFLDWAYRVGIRPGKELVLKQIRQVPRFFNQVTGQFDQQRYESELAAMKLTPALVEQDIRDQSALQHYLYAVGNGVRAPRIYGALVAGAVLQSRDGRWFEVTQAMVGQAPAPTDAQLQAFLNENAEQLRQPERRQVSVVVFTPEQSNAAISEERIAERFRFRKDALSQPERRTFVTLTAPSREAAERVAQALRAGQDPAAAGRTAGIQPQAYDAVPRAAVSDPAVAAAVFALQTNQVSPVVQGRVGFTVAKLLGVSPGAEATLDSARAAIVDELRREDLKAATFQRVQDFEKARQAGQGWAQAVQSVGARVLQLPPFDAQGQTSSGQRLNAPPQLLETAFGLPRGGESEVVDAGQGQYFTLRVDEVTPAALPPLQSIRPQLAQAWTARENARRLSARAEELAGRVRNGEDIAAVAASAGATLRTVQGVQQNRQAAEQHGPGVLQGLFSVTKGAVFAQQNSNTAFVVGRVDQVRPPAPTAAAEIANRVRPQIGQELGQALAQGGLEGAARRTKARYDVDQALLALGLPARGQAGAPAGAR